MGINRPRCRLTQEEMGKEPTGLPELADAEYAVWQDEPYDAKDSGVQCD